MVTTDRNRIFYLCLFLLPALVLYTMFFLAPLYQGIKYSLTDWNGIAPEIPLSMQKAEFESRIVPKINNKDNLTYISKYYLLDSSGFYRLTNWVKEGNQTRAITDRERKKIKSILKSVGVTPIKYIGFDNFREIINDQRFLPRIETVSLFGEFDDLPKSIRKSTFEKNLLNHIKKEDDRNYLLSIYKLDQSSYRFSNPNLSFEEEERLRIFMSENFYEQKMERGVIGFTLFFTFYNVIFANLLALILALILDTKMRIKNALRSMFFLPNVISLVIVAYVWSFMFRLIFPALTGITIWLGSPVLAPYATLMIAIWQGCGYLMIIYLAGLQVIPVEIVEVSEVDGANWYQRLIHVKFPLLLPAFNICLFYSIANSLKTFDILWALNQGGPGYATTSIVIDIYKNAFMQNRYGYATAKAVLLCLIIILITGFQQYLMKRREVEL